MSSIILERNPNSLNIDVSNGAGNRAIRDLDILSNGDVIIGGDFESVGGVDCSGLAILSNDLSTVKHVFNVPTYNDAGGLLPNQYVRAVKKISNSNVCDWAAGGTFTSIQATGKNQGAIDARGIILGFNNGTLNNTNVINFDVDGDPSLRSIDVLSDNRFIVTGSMNDVSTCCTKIDATTLGKSCIFNNIDCSINDAFYALGGFGLGGGGFSATTATELSDGKIVIGGSFASYEEREGAFADLVNINTDRLIVLNPDLSVDASFATGGDNAVGFSDTINRVKALQNNRFAVVGAFTTAPDGAHPDGETTASQRMVIFNNDASFNTVLTGFVCDGEINDIDQFPDGRIIIVGTFLNVQGQVSHNVVILTENGNVFRAFGNEFDGKDIDKVKVISNNSFFLVGDITSCFAGDCATRDNIISSVVTSIPCSHIVKYNLVDTPIKPAFNSVPPISEKMCFGPFNNYEAAKRVGDRNNARKIFSGNYRYPSGKVDLAFFAFPRPGFCIDASKGANLPFLIN